MNGWERDTNGATLTMRIRQAMNQWNRENDRSERMCPECGLEFKVAAGFASHFEECRRHAIGDGPNGGYTTSSYKARTSWTMLAASWMFIGICVISRLCE